MRFRRYFEFDCESGASLGLKCSSLATDRVQFSQHVEEHHDMWMNAWFQDLRQSLGLYKYSSAAGDARMAKQALGSVVLALAAPQASGGAFPSIFWLAQDSNGTSMHWADDSGWAGLCREEGSGVPPPNCTGFYHLYDNVWSSYWLLQWRKEPALPPALRSRIDAFVGRVAEFAASAQQLTPEPVAPDGVNGANGGGDLHGSTPAWFDGTTLAPRPEMRFNSETAAVRHTIIACTWVGCFQECQQ